APVARVLAAHTAGRTEAVLVTDALFAACERWERQVVACGSRLETDLDGVNDDGRTVDPHLLRTVIDPLVENGAQHGSEAGLVRVTALASDGTLTIRVSDDGPGVDPSVRDRRSRPWVASRAARGGTRRAP